FPFAFSVAGGDTASAFAAPPSLPGMPSAPPEYPSQQAAMEAANTQVTQAYSQALPPQSSTVLRTTQAVPGFNPTAPALPSAVSQYFLPASVTPQQAIQYYEQQTRIAFTGAPQTTLAYKPVLLGQASVRFQDRKTQLYITREYAFQIPTLERTGMVRWEDFKATPVDPRKVSGAAFGDAIFGELSSGLSDAKRMTALKGEMTDMLFNTERLQIPFNATLSLYGDPNAQESEFPARLQQAAREQRDQEADALAAKYQKQFDSIDEKMRREEMQLNAQKRQLADLKREELFTRGESLLSLFKGRTSFTLSRSSRVSRYKNQAGAHLSASEQTLADLEDKSQALQEQFQKDAQAVTDKWAKVATDVQAYTVTPYKKDIQVELFGVGWIPYYYALINGQPLLLQGFY
ncbi:MAG: hypothetical protein ABI970_15695, partial [Chloroflexota bacterium]